MKIVTVGDNCMDVYQNLDRFFPGGNPVNVAVYLKRMNAEAAYVGVVGDDEYGELMIDAIRSKGVDVSKLHKKPGKTAVTEVELVGNDRVFGDYYEGVLEDFVLDEEDMAFIRQHQIVHSGIWGKVHERYKQFKEDGIITSFDFSDKLDAEMIEKTAPYIDYVFFSHTADDEYIKNYIKHIKELGPKIVIATLGEHGSIAYDGVHFYREGIIPVKVVDTMGAGDSYIAGFLYGLSRGRGIEECMVLGAEEASKTITYFGAW